MTAEPESQTTRDTGTGTGTGTTLDRIEREILVEAPPERVWAVLTEPAHVGAWFCRGEPVPVDLRPGGTMLLDHGAEGRFPAVIAEVDPPYRFSYRWATAHPGETPTAENSTLVEFTLTAKGGDTLLRVVETGFAGLVIPEERRATASYESHSGGWTEQTATIKEYTERLPA
jgi:uncharacterized protein YndB with AHSA1/START domain